MGRQTKKDHRSGSLTRKQGTRNVKQSFLIVCEGVRTEPDYFKAFRMTTATVKATGQAMNTISLVNKAISIRDTEQKKKHYYDQCWVVCKHSKKCTFYTLRFGCSFAAVNTIKPQLL